MLSTDHTPLGPGTVDLAANATSAIRTERPAVVDAFSLLDHRTRSATIPAAHASRGRYLSLEDGDAVRLLRLTKPITHIGRGLVADVRLEDPHVSRRHAIVAVRGDGVRVLDDRSANGTFVNGRSVAVADLADGDVVRVGRAVLRYVEVDLAAPRPTSRRTPRRIPIARARRLPVRHGHPSAVSAA